MPQLPYLPGEGPTPQYPFDMKLGGPQSQSGCSGKREKISPLPLMELEPQESSP